MLHCNVIVSIPIILFELQISHLVTKMATLGKIGEFQPSVEEWTQYAERLEYFFTANGITTAEKKRATFLAVAGPTTYKLLRSMLAPTTLDEVAFSDVVKVLSDHYCPKPLEIISRFKFYNRSRNPGESVSTFISEVRALACFYNFGNSLDSMIRDRLVCGINDEQIQKCLLSEGDTLTLTKAMTLAQAIETTTKDAQLMQPQSAPIQVLKGDPLQRGYIEQKKPCYHCATPGHSPADCHFRMAKCHNCHKVGQLKKACTAGRTAKHVRKVTQDSPPLLDSENTEYTLFTVNSSMSKPIQVKVLIDKQQLLMEVDTGAAVLLVSEETYRMWPQKSPQQATTILRTYSGEQLSVCV